MGRFEIRGRGEGRGWYQGSVREDNIGRCETGGRGEGRDRYQGSVREE